jgi:DNA repair photolyase
MATQPTQPLRGRGATRNPTNRFERLVVLVDPDAELSPEDCAIAPRTEFFKDSTRSALARNDSPDIPFEYSLNPYRGCEHGCIYCYARPTHEYLGFSAGLDFETRIMVKTEAPRLLREKLSSKSWKPQTVSIGAATDPYQPIERKLRITRQCLEVFAEFGNPIAIVTKNFLVTRDLDILGQMAGKSQAAVFVSITTLDAGLTRLLEPRTSVPRRRLEAIQALARAGVPVGVMVAPVIPGLNDHEIPAILEAAAGAGARHAGHVMLRLPYAVADLFETWLDEHYPDRKRKILSRIREMRGGKLNETGFGTRMKGHGHFAEQVHDLFRLACRRCGLNLTRLDLDASKFQAGKGVQLSLFPDG